MGTTNIELIVLAKCLSNPNFNCICTNEINSRIINPIKVLLKNSNTNIIVNLNDSDKIVNGHWIFCLIENKLKMYYFSYEDPIPIEVNNTLWK